MKKDVFVRAEQIASVILVSNEKIGGASNRTMIKMATPQTLDVFEHEFPEY